MVSLQTMRRNRAKISNLSPACLEFDHTIVQDFEFSTTTETLCLGEKG